MKVTSVMFIIFTLASNIIAIKWLALSKISNHRNACAEAKRQGALTRPQMRLCNQALIQLKSAASSAMSTCQQAFSMRRWNCSSVNRAPHFGQDLTTGTREQAIVHAISSAAVVHEVGRACAQGHVRGCSCGRGASRGNGARSIAEMGFKWGGCDDNVRWASVFTRRFLDAHLKLLSEKDAQEMQTATIHQIDLHNNKAGRKLIEKSSRLQCKCHGVSGSCSVKTCWRALPPSLSELQTHWLHLYSGAVDAGAGGRQARGSSLEAASHSLLFLTKSPDHCQLDEKQGSIGTKGRTCNATATGHYSCGSMCCGRGYTSHMEESLQRCKCRYHWCCYVKCNTCSVKQRRDVCN